MSNTVSNQNWGMTSLGVGNGGKVIVWGENGYCGRRGLGYLSIACTPCSRRVFNSTPRAGLGFLRDINIQQLSVSEGAVKRLYFDKKEWWIVFYVIPTPIFFPVHILFSPQTIST